MDNAIPIEKQRLILAQMMREWQQRSFAATVNAKVAAKLGDEQMRDQATAQLKQAEAALIVLEEELQQRIEKETD